MEFLSTLLTGLILLTTVVLALCTCLCAIAVTFIMIQKARKSLNPDVICTTTVTTSNSPAFDVRPIELIPTPSPQPPAPAPAEPLKKDGPRANAVCGGCQKEIFSDPKRTLIKDSTKLLVFECEHCGTSVGVPLT